MGDDAEWQLENARVADEEERGAKEIESTDILPVREIVRSHISRQDDWHHKVPNVYHASDVWYCFRKLYYKYATDVEGAEPPHGVFEMGRRAEDVVFESLQAFYGKDLVRRGIVLEWHGLKKFKIVGKTDPVLFGPGLKPRVLYEVKSVAQGGSDYISGEHHKRQVSFYWSILRPERVIILHPSRKDVLDFGQHELSQDELKFYANQTAEFFTRFHEWIEKKELPPAAPRHSWECRYCPFLAKCKEDGGPGKVQ